MKILVTGAAGFIGFHTAKAFLIGGTKSLALITSTHTTTSDLRRHVWRSLRHTAGSTS